MEPRNQSNQTPEQENLPEKDENISSAQENNQEQSTEPASNSEVPVTDETPSEAVVENPAEESSETPESDSLPGMTGAKVDEEEVSEEETSKEKESTEAVSETKEDPVASASDSQHEVEPQPEADVPEDDSGSHTDDTMLSTDLQKQDSEADAIAEETLADETLSEPVSETQNDKLSDDADKESVVSEQVEATDRLVEAEATQDKEVAAQAESVAAASESKPEQQQDDDEDEEDEEVEEIYQNLSRAELVDLIENIVQEPDVQDIKVKVALIKVAFLQKEKDEQQAQYNSYLQSGGVTEDYSPAPDQLSERFQMAFNVYREKKQRYNEELEKEKHANLEAKKKILEELKTLISSEETLKKTYDEFKVLQEQWKQIGMVPKNEINQLWQNYHFLVEKFFDKVKINKELKDLDLKKNLEKKIELCERAEELLLETSILKSFKQLQQYHEDWKEVGPVPQDKKDEIWERFKTASDQINERRREYYNTKQSEFESNYLAKTALCEKAEKLVAHNPETLKQWQNRTGEVNELLRVWKTIGQAPKKVNNEIWNRFKTCLDSHFTSYKEFLSRLKEQQIDNYNRKLDLCAQAEAIKNSTDWRNTTQELIRLQKDWKALGPVPRKHSDKIWKRFRSACDEFFQRKSEYFSSLAEVEESNKLKKEELIKKLEEFEFSDNRSENLETLKNFQREWLEIGHVPIKEKDRLQNAFRIVINKHFGRLKIDANEINAISYKNRLESIKDKPDAGRVLSRERNTLQSSIHNLQEDILLWENNIGFLADSKNANIVKVEFQKKIDQAKQELALMEAKLRYLKEI